MRYGDIEKKPLIKKEHLDPNQYTLSLIKEGYEAGLMIDADVEHIQNQLMLLLGDLIMKYTKNESTSVKVETAQSILMSILYSVDTCITRFNNPEQAIQFLKSNTIKEIYNNGFGLVELCLFDTEQLYQEVKKNKLHVPIQAYHSTIDEALPDFFRNYDVKFQAQDTMASIDYPLLFDDMQILGIFYIKQYLEKLLMENEFCSFFSKEDVEKLLVNYGRVYGIDYRESLINIFEILLTNSIFSVLASNNARELIITNHQFGLLQKELLALNHTLCSSLISNAIRTLITDLNIDKPELIDYIWNFKSVLMPRFLSALDNNALENVIILDNKDTRPIDILFAGGINLDNETFRILVDQIMECPDIAGKAEIIKSRIHSLGDFIDILEANCLFGDEFDKLFNTLGDMELSILARIVFVEGIRSNANFSLRNVGETLIEIQWQDAFIRFIKNLSAGRLKSIDNYIHSSFQTISSDS